MTDGMIEMIGETEGKEKGREWNEWTETYLEAEFTRR